jgi:hypothetical protein
VTWGWTHAPFLQGVIDDNLLADADGGTILGTEHSRYVKSNQGRTYMTVALRGNTVRWSEPFLKQFAASSAGAGAPTRGLPPGLILGYAPSSDPAEFVVKAAENRLDAPAGVKGTGSLVIHAAEYNGQRMLNRKFALPRASQPAGSARSTADRPLR